MPTDGVIVLECMPCTHMFPSSSPLSLSALLHSETCRYAPPFCPICCQSTIPSIGRRIRLAYVTIPALLVFVCSRENGSLCVYVDLVRLLQQPPTHPLCFFVRQPETKGLRSETLLARRTKAADLHSNIQETMHRGDYMSVYVHAQHLRGL